MQTGVSGVWNKKKEKKKKRNAVLWVLNIAFKVNAPFYPYLHYPNEKLYTKKIQKVIEKQSTFFTGSLQ